MTPDEERYGFTFGTRATTNELATWVGRVRRSAGSAARVDRVSIFRTPQVILFSADLPRAVEFYTRLGFIEAFRTPADGDPIHVDLVLDGYKLGIASVESTRDDHGLDPVPEGQRAAVILWTDDTAAAYDQLGARGVPGIAGPHRWLDRLLIAWVADPDGNPVQIVQSS